uniref:RNA-directed DNA polymerase n=1 Tax=Strongyloides papillosus TaxID=174720 RepID=A0A0N5C2X2_STREA
VEKKESKFGKYYDGFDRYDPPGEGRSGYSNNGRQSPNSSGRDRYRYNRKVDKNNRDNSLLQQMISGLGLAVNLDKFTGEDEAFSVWLTRFEALCRVRKIGPEDKAAVLIMHLAKNPARDIATRIELQLDYYKLVDYLNENYKGAMNENAARARLDMLTIKKPEDIRKVGSEISTLVDIIEKDSNLKERFRKKLYKLADLVPASIRGTLKYGGCCDTFELAMVVAEDLWRINDEVKRTRPGTVEKERKNSKSGDREFNDSCFKCGVKGHRAKECKKESSLQVSSVNISKLNKLSRVPIIPMTVDGISIHAMLDTGASISVMSKKLGETLKVPVEKKKMLAATLGSGKWIVYRAKVCNKLKMGKDEEVKVKCFVSGEEFRNYDMILGTDVLSKVKLTVDMKNDKVVINDEVIKLCMKNEDNELIVNSVYSLISPEDKSYKEDIVKEMPKVDQGNETTMGLQVLNVDEDLTIKDREKFELTKDLKVCTGEKDEIEKPSDDEKENELPRGEVEKENIDRNLDLNVVKDLPSLKKLYFGTDSCFDKITIEEQLRDPWIREIYNEKKFENRKVEVLNGQIMIEDLTGEGYVVLIPKLHVGKVLNISHNLSGHYNSSKVYERLKNSCYWKGMLDDIVLYVKRCKKCGRRSNRFAKGCYGRSCRTSLNVRLGKQTNPLVDKDVARWTSTKNAEKAPAKVKENMVKKRGSAYDKRKVEEYSTYDKENMVKNGGHANDKRKVDEYSMYDKGKLVDIRRPPFSKSEKVVADLGSKLKSHKGTKGRCCLVHKLDVKRV